jgi:hypothetical protein
VHSVGISVEDEAEQLEAQMAEQPEAQMAEQLEVQMVEQDRRHHRIHHHLNTEAQAVRECLEDRDKSKNQILANLLK